MHRGNAKMRTAAAGAERSKGMRAGSFDESTRSGNPISRKNGQSPPTSARPFSPHHSFEKNSQNAGSARACWSLCIPSMETQKYMGFAAGQVVYW